MSDDKDMDQHKIGGTNFGFSAVKIGSNLGASEYTLFGLAVDTSGSVEGFGTEIEACVRNVFDSCQNSPRADNLMARMITFNHHIQEVHGFKLLADCHLGAYKGCIRPGGGTALYDASGTMIESVAAYGKDLISQDYSVNGLVCVITDGIENGDSTLTVNSVKEAFARAMTSESLESLVSILIGVNVTRPEVGDRLKQFKTDAGFREYIEVDNASAKTMARLAGFISKSVSSQSVKVGSKTPSQPITY